MPNKTKEQIEAEAAQAAAEAAAAAEAEAAAKAADEAADEAAAAAAEAEAAAKAAQDEANAAAAADPSTKNIMYAPEGVNSASFDGVEYVVNKSGSVKVPFAAIEALRAHGFTTDKPVKE